MTVLDAACDRVQALWPDAAPDCAIVFGSGWSRAVEDLPVSATVEYRDIPCMAAGGIEGHAGRLAMASWEGLDVALFQGRRHWYEGLGWEPVVLPVMLSKRMGARILVLTNAAGGIRADLRSGHLMVIDDHINLMPSNPLVGPHNPELGPRFPDQSAVYDRGLNALMDEAGRVAGISLAHGTYLATSGPVYETPAEVRAFRMMGADAVGMSTVPEAITAQAAGMRVAAISCITNPAAGAPGSALSHQDVLQAAHRSAPDIRRLLDAFFRLLNGSATRNGASSP